MSVREDGGPYQAFDRVGLWTVERQFACINGLSAWFVAAECSETTPEEAGYTDGAFPAAEERARSIAEALNYLLAARSHQEPVVKLADVIAVVDDNQYALERVPVGWNLLVKIRKGINEIPVVTAPSPPADIAGLVERLQPRWAADEPVSRAAVSNNQQERRDTVTAFLVANNALKREAATALTRIAQERDEAIADRNINWRHWQVWKERAEAAEARLASARDEALDAMNAALHFITDIDNSHRSARMLRNAIRALKTEGTKP